LSPPIDPETIAPSLPSEEIAWRRRQARRQLAEVRRLLEAESYAFMEALADADNNQSLLAQRSGIHRNTVGRRWARIKRQLIRCPIENVTAHERHQLAEMATAPEIRARDRFKARLILALVAGASYGEIAKEFQTSRPTISRWKRRFQKGGMAGLKARHRGKKPDVVSRRLVANWLRRQRRQGMAPGCPSSRSIARTLGISKSTVHRILRAHRRQKS
jgi:transposase